MRIHLAQRRVAGRRMAHHAMTLVEMMVAMGIFGFVVIGLVYAHLFGLKQDQLVQSKLGASDQSRRGFSQLALDVRSCKSWRIGNGNLAGFEPIPNGAAQVGNALMVYPMTGTNAFVMYYFDTTRRELHRGQSGVADTRLVAQNLTNTMYFRAENYRGEVQTDLSHKGVINVMLQFCQYQYPLTQVGPGHYYDYYKMEFRLTSHVPDGP